MEKATNTFMDECTHWLKPYGYTVHSHNWNRTTITYMAYPGNNYAPTIKCWIEGEEKRCSLSYAGLKLFIGLQAGPIQFKHPDIGRFIYAMTRYATVCEENNPFTVTPNQ